MSKMIKSGAMLISVIVLVFTLGTVASAAVPTATISYNTETIIGLANTMQYSLDKTAWVDVWGATLDVSSLISNTKDVDVYIRTIGEEAYQTVILTKRPAAPTGIAYNATSTTEKINITASEEYKTDLLAWTQGSSSGLDTSKATARATITVRTKATTGAFASVPINITVPVRPAAPAVSYDPATDSVKGATTAMEYQKTGADYVDVPSGGIKREDLDTDGKVYVRYKATGAVPKSPSILIQFSDPVGAPAGISIDYPNEKFAGASDWSGYEFSKDNGSTYAPIPANITSLIPASNTQGDGLPIKIRYKAVTTAPTKPASADLPLTIAKRQDAPTAGSFTFDGPSESITGVSNLHAYKLSTASAYTPVTGSDVTFEVDVLNTAVVTYSVIFKATDTAPASLPLNVTVPKRAAAPAVSYDATTDTVKGVTTLMEYATTADSSSWTTVSDTKEIDREKTAASKVFVRVKATGAVPSSVIKEVVFPDEKGAPANIAVDYANEKLTGSTEWAKLEYSKDGGVNYLAIPASQIITTLIPANEATSNLDIKIRYKAVTGTAAAPASDSLTVTIVKRPPTPTADAVKFVAGSEEISVTGVTSPLEYKTATAYTDVSGTKIANVVSDTAALTYSIRVKAKTAEPASLPLTIAVPKRAAAPAVSYDATTDKVKGVTPLIMEYAKTKEAVTWTTVQAADEIDRDETEANKVYVRVKATDSAPKSLAKEVVFPAEKGAPTDIQVDYVNEKLTGLAAAEWAKLEYSKDNGSTYAAIPAGQSIASLIKPNGGGAVVILVRYKAVTVSPISPASEDANVTITERLATPSASAFAFDAEDETITGVGATHEYKISTAAAYTAGTSTNEIPQVVSNTAAVTYSIRLKATTERPASAAVTVTVPKRAVAPTVAYDGVSDTIKTVSDTMEYRLTSTGDFTPVPGNTTALARGVWGSAAGPIEIRVAATATLPASAIKSIAKPLAVSTAPPVSINYETEVLAGSTTAMEYSTDNGVTWIVAKASQSLTTLIPAYDSGDKVLLVRTKATATKAASQAAEFDLKARPATPLPAAVYFDTDTEKLVGSSGLQYKISTATAYVAPPAADIEPDLNKSYVLRVPSNEDAEKFPSLTLTVKIPARPAAPAVAYDGVSDTIKTVSNKMEYRLTGENGTFTKITDASTTALGRDIWEDATGTTIDVRLFATDSAPASAIKSIAKPTTIKDKPELSIDYEAEILIGSTAKMEYSLNDTNKWTVAKASQSLTTLIPAFDTPDVTLHVRVKATATLAASAEETFVLKARPATPAAASVYFDTKTEKIVGSNGLQYRLSTVTAYTLATAVVEPTLNKSYVLRVPSNKDDELFPSLALTVKIPARPATPKPTYDAATDAIKGVTEKMEWSKDGGDTWVDVGSKKTVITRYDISESAEKTILVRVKYVDKTAPASLSASVKFIGLPT